MEIIVVIGTIEMTIKPICDKCEKELEEFGAILLSPPDECNKVEKFHLCIECYEEIKSMIRRAV